MNRPRNPLATIRDLLLILVLGLTLLCGCRVLTAADDKPVDTSPKTVEECRREPADEIWTSCARYR